MPDIEWNKTKWGSSVWPDKGNNWSEAWGGPDIQWLSTLRPRLGRLLPTGRIVEIAPGYGRWTNYLLDECEQLTGYDLNERCIASCEERFAAAVSSGRGVFFVNDGLSLPQTEADSASLVFSFDSLVHVEQDVIDSYLGEIERVLRPGGHAFLHHSNLGSYTSWTERPLGRGASVSAQSVKSAAMKVGLQVVVQELISWQSEGLRDCMTLLIKSDKTIDSALVTNEQFWAEAGRSKEILGAWHRAEAAPA